MKFNETWKSLRYTKFMQDTMKMLLNIICQCKNTFYSEHQIQSFCVPLFNELRFFFKAVVLCEAVFDLPLKIFKEMVNPMTHDSWIQLNVHCNVLTKNQTH